MSDDAQLLRLYVESRSEPAFAELVQRYIGVVYHAALRQLGADAHLADDVVQSVFILLAEKSRTLLGHPSLAGWLHTATRFKVAHARRAEHRRAVREHAAQLMSELTREPPAADWDRIRPILDNVLLELSAADREAVLLRYFANLGFAEIGARLQTTEDTAHKRVERALDRLRERLARRGIKSTAVALATLLGAESMQATPAGLAASVTSTVIGSGLPVAATFGGLAFMSTKTAVGLGLVAAIVFSGVATYEVRTNREALARLAIVERDTSALQAKLRSEKDRLARERAVRSAPPPATATARIASGNPGPTMTERIADGRAFLKANPEFAAAYTAYLKNRLRVENADLIARMGLSEDETERFIAVLADGRMQIVGQHFLRLTDEEMTPGEYTRQLRQVLGEERYRLYRADNRIAPARSLADDLTRALYYTPTPLTPPQIAQFKQVALQTLDDGSLGKRYSGLVSMYIPLPVWDELAKRAVGVLSPPQLDALANLRAQAAFFHAQTAARAAYDKKP